MDQVNTTLPEEGAPKAVPGSYAVMSETAFGADGLKVFRPAQLESFPRRDKLPVVVWGNGGCAINSPRYAGFLETIASHGFLVITTAAGGAARATAESLKAGIDWAEKEYARAGSPLAGKIDTSQVAVMGQSCGGLQATAVAADPRIDTVVIWNSGVFSAGANSAGASMSGATKESLATFHAPVAYFPGGPSDLAYGKSKDDFSRITTAQAFFGSINVGHGGTFRHPGGGWFGEVGLAWLDWHLKGDSAAAKYFEGADCILCKNPIWEVAKKNME
jgi:dienelactone hydrolase